MVLARTEKLGSVEAGTFSYRDSPPTYYSERPLTLTAAGDQNAQRVGRPATEGSELPALVKVYLLHDVMTSSR